MTELDKISNRPEHNANYIHSDNNGKTLVLDGCFTRGQLLELAFAMKTPDNDLSNKGSESSLSDFGPDDMPLG
jgi:hypothetical protein